MTDLFLILVAVAQWKSLLGFCFLIIIIWGCKLELFEIGLCLLVDVNELAELLIFEHVNPSSYSIEEVLKAFLPSRYHRCSGAQKLFWREIKELLDACDSWVRVGAVEKRDKLLNFSVAVCSSVVGIWFISLDSFNELFVFAILLFNLRNLNLKLTWSWSLSISEYLFEMVHVFIDVLIYMTYI